MELKTGALMNLAMRLGTAIAGIPDDIQIVSETAVRLGTLLQILDDSGNLFGHSPKKFEDITLRRPTWIWSVASEFKDEEYDTFVDCSKNLTSLLEWIEDKNFETLLRNRTFDEMLAFEQWLDHNWFSTHPESVAKIKSIINLLEKSYGR